MQVSLTARIVDMIWFDQQIHTYSYIGYTKPVYYGSKLRYSRDHTIAHIQYCSTLFYHQQFGGQQKIEPLPCCCSLRHQTFSLPLPHWKAAREAADLIRGANPDPHRWSMLQWHISKWKPWWLLTDIEIALLTHSQFALHHVHIHNFGFNFWWRTIRDGLYRWWLELSSLR